MFHSRLFNLDNPFIRLSATQDTNFFMYTSLLCKYLNAYILRISIIKKGSADNLQNLHFEYINSDRIDKIACVILLQCNFK